MPLTEIGCDEFAPRRPRDRADRGRRSRSTHRLGFILSMALLLSSLVVLERRSIVSAALYGACVSVATYALFSLVLKSPLERGLLGF